MQKGSVVYKDVLRRCGSLFVLYAMVFCMHGESTQVSAEEMNESLADSPSPENFTLTEAVEKSADRMVIYWNGEFPYLKELLLDHFDRNNKLYLVSLIQGQEVDKETLHIYIGGRGPLILTLDMLVEKAGVYTALVKAYDEILGPPSTR